METVDLGSSFDEDDDDDVYLNSVAKLKALKTKKAAHISNEKNEVKEVIEEEAKILKDEIPKVVATAKRPVRTTRNNKRRPSRKQNQKDTLAEQDSDLEIVSVEEPSKVLNPSENDVAVIETNVDSSEDENYDITIKILWRSKDMHRLNIRQNENFQKIFEYFAKLEQVSVDEILITKKDKTLTKNDTPISINLSVIDILEGGIVKKGATLLQNAEEKVDEDARIIKVQTTTKKSISMSIKRDDNFEGLLEKCAQELNVEESKIKLYFDGELVAITDTPDSLDIEDEACFDLRLAS